MSGWPRRTIRSLLSFEVRPKHQPLTTEVWNLNLDQIESHSGRVIEKVYVNPEKLGPSTFAFEPKTVLYSKLRPYLNKVVVANEAGVATTELVPIRCNSNDVLPEYLAYFLRSQEFLSFATATVAGAKMPRMVMSDFWEFQVPLPPIPEQRRIAAILDQADALRAKRREALAQLDSLTQSIFIEMFGDPTANVMRWPTVRLSDLVITGDTINYGVVQPGDDVEEGIPLVRVGDLIDGRVRHDSLKKITPEIESAYKRSRLHGDEILVSCVGTIGVVVLVKESEKGFNIARAVARIRLSHGTSREFVAAQLLTESVQRYFTEELRTVSQPTLNIKQLSETKLMWPPVSLQAEFSNRIASLSKLKFSAQRASSEQDALFVSLQHRAFRGEL